MRCFTTTALGVFVTALALTGCAGHAEPANTSTSGSAHQEGGTVAPALLSSIALSKRLLDESDLGEGYVRMPDQPKRHDDVTVTGCPALAQLGDEAATGGGLTFPRQAKASFTYAGGNSSLDLSEELYSDSEAKLSDGMSRVFEAMTSCPTYQLLVGGSPITVTTQTATAPRLGDERWSQLLTFTTGGRSTVVKQTAVRTGTVVVTVAGSPALVDAHLARAVDKAG